MTKGLRERFGRPLRLGLVGGGPDSWIGNMHRGAAEMFGWFRATAGVFSSNAERSRAGGAALGSVRLVQVEYIQSGLAVAVEDGPQNDRLRWVLDAERSGQVLVMSAIGCHAQHLACFVSGLQAARVVADVGALLPGRRVADHVSALIAFAGGARGAFTVTQAAAGGENDIRLRIYGSLGMLDWSHREASYLKLAMQGEPVRTIGRGDPGLPPEILALGRTPRGHPEGLREAFANIYAEVAQQRIAIELGEPVPELPYPHIEEGAHTMAFIEACVASQTAGSWVDVAQIPSH